MPVVDDLKLIGGGSQTVHQEFNQTTFRGPHQRFGGVSLGNGYCAGVVLDWARRVLQSAEDRNPAYLNFSNKRQNLPTLARMAKAYHGQTATYSSETDRSKVVTLLNAAKTGTEVNYSDYGLGVPVTQQDASLLAKVWPIPGSPGTIFHKFDLNAEPAGVIKKSAIDFLLNNLASKPDPQHTPNEANSRLWQTFAAELDDKFVAQRRNSGKEAKKLYSNIAVERCSILKLYRSSDEQISELMGQGFQQGCCTIINFYQNDGAAGHTVAAYQKSDVSYYFFDPNWGVFTYTKQQLRDALQHLFLASRVEAGSHVLDGDKPVYMRRDDATAAAVQSWNKMGYTIFARIA